MVGRICCFLMLFSIAAVSGAPLISIGEVAPDFTLASHTGDTIHLAEVLHKSTVVLIFYPGDATPGCTKQLCEIRDDYSRFTEAGAVVYGVNPASAVSHRKFAKKQGYEFPLLVDENSLVAKRYGTKGTLMTVRTVYVINRQRKIIFAQRGKPSIDEIIASMSNGNPQSESDDDPTR